MTQRIDPRAVAPELYAAAIATETYLGRSVDRTIYHLVKMRASMLNGCAFCIDMHSADALREGERPERLFGLAAWREAPFYTDTERAALALTDAATRLGDDGVPDDVWAAASAVFDAKQLVDLVGAIAMINFWNRVSVATRKTPLSAGGSL